MRRFWMAAAAAMALAIPVMAGPAAAQGPSAVQEAQQALSQRGLDPGPIDGMMGQRTRQAIMEFQRQNNLPASGRLDQRTAQALNVQADTSMRGHSGMRGGGGSSRAARSAEPRDERDRAYMGGGMVGGSATGAGSSYGGTSGSMGGGAGTMTPGYNTGSTGPGGTSNLGSGNQPGTGGTTSPR